MKFKEKCPKCGASNVFYYNDYSAPEVMDDSVYWEADCQDCDCQFQEVYDLNFLEQVIIS